MDSGVWRGKAVFFFGSHDRRRALRCVAGDKGEVRMRLVSYLLFERFLEEACVTWRLEWFSQSGREEVRASPSHLSLWNSSPFTSHPVLRPLYERMTSITYGLLL